MAKVVNELPSDQKRRYPWDQWLDGQVWELTKDVDYSVTMAIMRSLVYTTCKHRGLAVKICVRGNQMYIQASKKEG